MTIRADSMAVARARLADRIDQIARELSHISVARIAFAVDDIRREAVAVELTTLATLAGGLERALARSGGTAVVIPYLEAMSDALDSVTGPACARQAETTLLAAVGVRLHS